MEKKEAKAKKEEVDDDDSEREREQAANAPKDPQYMTSQLQGWLNQPDYYRALKWASGRISRGAKTSMFYAVISAYCYLKSGKTQECLDTLADYKGQKPLDTQTAKHLSLIYDGLGRHDEATQVLEGITAMYPGKRELMELLFFSYVREGNLLKQQNQALSLYKNTVLALHAQWAVESMYLISLNLKFETKVLDIAYLLMLKLMKEQNFTVDKKFVMLYIKILKKQGKHKDAVQFIERMADWFKDKTERQRLEADLFLKQQNYIMSITIYFNMLRLNSHIQHHEDMWKEYKECIAIVCHEFLFKKNKFEFKIDIERQIGKEDNNGVNFDPITLEAQPEDVMVNLMCSLRNMRVGLVTDTTQKKIIDLANSIQRTSYLTELEYKFVLALNYSQYPTNEGSSFFNTVLDYIMTFNDRFDVIGDVRSYLCLLSEQDAGTIRAAVRSKLETEEKAYANQELEEEQEEKPPHMALIRMRIVHFTLEKLTGQYERADNFEKYELVNRITQTYLWGHGVNKDELTQNDKRNLDDLIIIAVEVLYTLKVYDWSVLNPINFQMIILLEMALEHNQSNNSLRLWLMKMLQKLGLSGRFTAVSANIKGVVDENFEKFGALKYSHYQSFGVESALEQTCTRYEKYYAEVLAQNKAALVKGFGNRDFEDLNVLLNKNERLQNSYFSTVVQMSKIHAEIVRNASDKGKVQKELNAKKDLLNQLCDEDTIPPMAKVNVKMNRFEPVRLGQQRDRIKDEVMMESIYDEKFKKKKEDRDADRDRKSSKGHVRVFGYKHPKVMKFMALLLRCLKDCIDGRHDQLNLDMNSFLLLKNELSLAFLRNMDNIVATVKAAIKLYASQDESSRRDLEAKEIQVIEGILRQAAEAQREKQEKASTLGQQFEENAFGSVSDPSAYEKIISKLLEYNEKVNEGKEISVVEYLKRIDMDSEFAKTYETQRHIKRAFFEEFKIHSLNYVLLLFECVMRVLTTTSKDHGGGDDGRGDKMQYYSKNYRRFIENRQKKLDKFIVNCIGWNHINRCIEVIDMALRDLLYKIVPTKVIIRELKTSSGKVLTRDSEYTLVERKRYVTVGKKTHVDYIFELDLKEDSEKISAQAKQKAAEEAKKRANVFYLNFEDFSIVKLKAAVFMNSFPITFTVAILNVWLRIIPNPSSKSEIEGMTKEEIDEIVRARHSLKDFVNGLLAHIKSLSDYLNSVIKEKPLQTNFQLIRESPEFQAFETVFHESKYSGMTAVEIEERFLTNFEKIELSWSQTVENVAKLIIRSINNINVDILKKL